MGATRGGNTANTMTHVKAAKAIRNWRLVFMSASSSLLADCRPAIAAQQRIHRRKAITKNGKRGIIGGARLGRSLQHANHDERGEAERSFEGGGDQCGVD